MLRFANFYSEALLTGSCLSNDMLISSGCCLCLTHSQEQIRMFQLLDYPGQIVGIL